MNVLAKIPVRYLLIFIVMSVALPAAGIIVNAGYQQKKQALNDARISAQRLSERIVFEQERMAALAQKLMVSLSQLPDIKNRNAAKTTSLLTDIHKLHPEFTNIFIADRSGSVWASAVPVKSPFIVSDRRYFKNALASGHFSSGEYIVARAGNQPSFTFGYPIKDKRGEITGVIAIGFLLNKYTQHIELSKLPRNASYVLRDHRGVILYRAVDPDKYIGKETDPAQFKEIQESPEEGTTLGKSVSIGDERIISTRKLRLEGEPAPYMYIRVGIPVKSALSGVYSQLFKNTLLLGLIIVAAILLSSFVAKRFVVARIELLDEAARLLAGGHYSGKMSKLVKGGELGRLAESLDTMANDLVQREATLARSERFLKAIIDTEPECIKLLDIDSNLLMMNRAGLDMIEADSFEQIKGHCVCPIVTPPYREAFAALTRQVFQGHPGTLEFEIVGLKGRHVWLETHAVPFRNEDDEIVSLLGITRDVTERKQAEQAIRESNERFAVAFNNAPIMMTINSLEDGTYLDINRQFTVVSGFSREEVIGRTSVELGWLSAADRQLMIDNLMREGRIQDYDLSLCAKSGKTIHCKYWGEIITFSGQKRLLSIAIDVTEHRSVEQQLFQAQKMESVGRLAGGVAHDFNNILMVIQTYSHLCLMEADPAEPSYSFLNEIGKATRRAADLTRQLLSFARKQAIAPKVVDLNDTVEGMLKMLQRMIGEDVQLIWQPAESLWKVNMDPSQIDQILANLCVNARDAIDNIGRIIIKTDKLRFDENNCAEHPDLKAGEYVLISVSDNGCGMDKETMEKIFEPFFTTKGAHQGTGLGLAMVYGIVKQNNGTIEVFSELGEGSTFRIYLPRFADEEPQTQKITADEPVEQGQGTILLVEDDPGILKLCAMTLEKSGYTVVAAHNGDEAVRLLKEYTGKIQLVVTDVIMPGMNGRDLTNCIQSLNPQIKCLFMSGYTADIIARHGVLDNDVNFIQKPFSMTDLATKVKEVLGAEHGDA